MDWVPLWSGRAVDRSALRATTEWSMTTVKNTNVNLGILNPRRRL